MTFHFSFIDELLSILSEKKTYPAEFLSKYVDWVWKKNINLPALLSLMERRVVLDPQSPI